LLAAECCSAANHAVNHHANLQQIMQQITRCKQGKS